MDRQKTVLIVEDEKNIVDILRFNLQREGYQTLEAYDGEDGLNKARSEKPDLILLDVMLPRMNGFDVCRALRQAGGDPVPGPPPQRERGACPTGALENFNRIFNFSFEECKISLLPCPSWNRPGDRQYIGARQAPRQQIQES